MDLIGLPGCQTAHSYGAPLCQFHQHITYSLGRITPAKQHSNELICQPKTNNYKELA